MSTFSVRNIVVVKPLMGLILGLAFGVMPLTAYAEGGTTKQPSITVTATGEAFAEPDMASLDLAVIDYGKTAQSALENSNKAMNKVINTLKKNGIEQRDLQTLNLSLSPVEKNEKGKKPVDANFRIYNYLSVNIRDINKAGSTLDNALEAGATAISGVTFINADPTPYYTEARKKAVAKAIDQANTLAQAANIKLGSIISINEDAGSSGFGSRLASRSQYDYEAPTHLSSGELAYRVNVTVTFAIDQ